MSKVEDEEFLRLMAIPKAQTIWDSLDDNAKTGIRFGLFPAAVMRAAEAEGHDMRLLSVALMDCASRDGGMRA